ncbi:MAG: hypothetical protein M1269_04190 [Chloroflexi bacterium]|nr:hypothetical protein [Chloroflexota bacterium]
MKKILIYGSREFGRVIKDLAIQAGFEVAGFIDDFNSGDGILGDFEHVRKNYPPGSYEILVAVGYKDLKARWEVCRKIISAGYKSPVIIHSRAYVRDPGAVGQGAVIMAGAIVDMYCRIGDFAVLWPGVTVAHDSIVGANTFLSPNCTVCGGVTIGDGCFIGAGAIIADHNEVPSGSFVKAGRIYYLPGRKGDAPEDNR